MAPPAVVGPLVGVSIRHRLPSLLAALPPLAGRNGQAHESGPSVGPV